MRRLVEAVKAADPDAVCRESEKGPLYGARLGYGSGSLPGIDIHPDHLFVSMQLGDCEMDDNLDTSFRTKVLAFLEACGYVGFDPQKGRLTTSQDFSFRDVPATRASTTPPKPWCLPRCSSAGVRFHRRPVHRSFMRPKWFERTLVCIDRNK